MKKTLAALFLVFCFTNHATAMEATTTYSHFCIGVENQVEGEKMFVKTLYVPNGEILETTHKEGEEIEFGKTFTVKLKVKDRPGVYPSTYRKEFEELGLLGNVVVGNDSFNYLFILYNSQGYPDIFQGGKLSNDTIKKKIRPYFVRQPINFESFYHCCVSLQIHDCLELKK